MACASEYRQRAAQSVGMRVLRHQMWAKWRRLAIDKEFRWETARLKFNLTRAYLDHPDKLKKFFRPNFYPAASQVKKIRGEISKLKNGLVRSVLARYMRYVSRFGVTMTLRSKPPYFRLRAIAPPGPKFHVMLKRDHFEPVVGWPEEEDIPFKDFFESETLEVGPALQSLIDSGVARYVHIEDESRWSLLRQLADFAYAQESLTFIKYNADEPFFFCLIGENVSADDTWRRASKVLREFQEKHYGRIRAGRPPNIRQLAADLNILLRNPGSLTHKAITRTPPPHTARQVYGKMSTLSQMKRRLTI
jgi:hypothetical protein